MELNFDTYRINWINVNPYITFNEKTNFEAIIEINEFLVGRIEFDDMEYQIWDFSLTNELLVTDNEIEIIYALDKSSSIWNKTMKVALIAIDESIINLCLQYKESMNDTVWRVEIFKTAKDALNWCKSK